VKAATREKKGNGPAVVRFEARLARDGKASKNGSLMLVLPKAASTKLRGMGTLEGTINGHPFRAPLEMEASGAHRLRVNAAMRNGSRAREGDTVKLAVLGPEPEPKVPTDLRTAFSASREAQVLWKDLNTDGRRIYLRWIAAAKTPETRARRVRRTVEQLAEGKRRPCCVNVYEFMLDRVQG